MQDFLGPGVFEDSLCHCKLLPSVHCFPLCLAQAEQATESCDNKTDFIKIAGSEAWGIIWGRGALFFFVGVGSGGGWTHVSTRMLGIKAKGPGLLPLAKPAGISSGELISNKRRHEPVFRIRG